MKKLLTTLILPIALSVGLMACNKGDANKTATEAEKPAATANEAKSDTATLENLSGKYKADNDSFNLDRVGNTNEYTLSSEESKDEVISVEARMVGGVPQLFVKKPDGVFAYLGKFEGKNFLDDEGKFYKKQ